MYAKGSGVGWIFCARRVWRVARWIFLALAIAYIALIIYRIPAVREEKISQATVAKIGAQKLTIDDVDGTHLPPAPDPSQANATLAGVDANDNGIRDDVEASRSLQNIQPRPQAQPQFAQRELQYANGASGVCN